MNGCVRGRADGKRAIVGVDHLDSAGVSALVTSGAWGGAGGRD